MGRCKREPGGLFLRMPAFYLDVGSVIKQIVTSPFSVHRLFLRPDSKLGREEVLIRLRPWCHYPELKVVLHPAA